MFDRLVRRIGNVHIDVAIAVLAWLTVASWIGLLVLIVWATVVSLL